jgi:hypothetical protein
VSPRLTSKLLVNALMRQAQAAGGNVMILAKGDETSGILLIQCASRGVGQALLERQMTASGGYAWVSVGPPDMGDLNALTLYIERRRRSDPDLWVVELDIPNAERFVATALDDG